MSDTYTQAGPLGENPHVLSSDLGGKCVTTTFDSAGRIITLCPSLTTTRLFMINPGTSGLGTLAYLDLPAHQGGTTEFAAGGYFYLDNDGNALIPTTDRTVWVVGETTTAWGSPAFTLTQTLDLSKVVPSNDSIQSVLPDVTGRLWFVTEGGSADNPSGGIVGTLNRDGSNIQTVVLKGERITNSFAIDETGGVFVASDHAMYRFDPGSNGAPVITWRQTYDRGHRLKPGQNAQGTGTTPTLMGQKYVTITDNADPYMHVLVYQRAANVNGSRLVCSQSVFGANVGSDENSLIATDQSIIVENNYGYKGPDKTMNGNTTQPGVTRIDIDANSKCHKVWTSKERVPNAVSKMSVGNGLIYTYTKNPGPGQTDAWYFTAIDFHTGQTVFKQLVGTGYNFDSHYAGVYLGPDGTAYVGLLSGLTAIMDAQQDLKK
jgi:hypothetical protein